MRAVKVKKTKGIKRCVLKRKLKFENYKNCLKVTQIENEIKHMKKEINIGSLKKS